MKKIVYIVLIVTIIGLSTYLIHNINQYNDINKTNEQLTNDIKKKENELEEINQKNIEAQETYASLKEDKKEEILEYETWQKKIEELEQKMS